MNIMFRFFGSDFVFLLFGRDCYCGSVRIIRSYIYTIYQIKESRFLGFVVSVSVPTVLMMWNILYFYLGAYVLSAYTSLEF